MVRAAGEALREIAVSVPPFTLRFEGIGTYPDISCPKIIWAGVKEGSESCQKLAEALNTPLKEIGINTQDRKFSPHVTLGRLRGTDNADRLKAAISSIVFSGLSRTDITRIVLFESRLGTEGPVYTPLIQTKLAPPSK
jgi:2'-5' RNA ligase